MTVEWVPDGSNKKEDELPYDEEGIFEKNQNIKSLSRSVNQRSDSENSILSNHGLMRIIIKDTGCGIKKDDLDVVFEKYSQVNKDPSARKLGTGLGLFITKEICTRMDGEIKVYSKENIGTTFIVDIPV
jgi:signal transduction histidine kinase